MIMKWSLLHCTHWRQKVMLPNTLVDRLFITIRSLEISEHSTYKCIQDSILAKMSVSLKRWNSLFSSKTTLVPPYSGNRTLSPTFTAGGIWSPFCKIKIKELNFINFKYVTKIHIMRNLHYSEHLVQQL